MSSELPVMRVAKILDKKTIILSGKNLSKLNIGDDLAIFIIGPELEPGIPLVLPKAYVEVTDNLGTYIVASTPIKREEVDATGIAAFIGTSAKRYNEYRPALNVEDGAITGNPASRPVAIGDLVVRRKDLAEFAMSLSRGNEPPMLAEDTPAD